MRGLSCDVSQLPHCCGVYEAGYFNPYSASEYCDVNNKDLTKGFESILAIAKKQPVLFNFVKRRIDEDDDKCTEYNEMFDDDELRQLVMKHPKATQIAMFQNDNSGNIVNSWVIFEGENINE